MSKYLVNTVSSDLQSVVLDLLKMGWGGLPKSMVVIETEMIVRPGLYLLRLLLGKKELKPLTFT